MWPSVSQSAAFKMIEHPSIGRSGDVGGEVVFLRRSGGRWCVRRLGSWICSPGEIDLAKEHLARLAASKEAADLPGAQPPVLLPHDISKPSIVFDLHLNTILTEASTMQRPTRRPG